MERPEKYKCCIHSAPYVGIGQQVQGVRFYLLNYAVVPQLINIIPYRSLQLQTNLKT